jgi:biopolymer transport protein ExbD
VAISTGKSGGVTSEINVTPMIDVMLVLLIIFMIVTPLIAAGFKATLPRGANLDKDPEGKDEVVLGIDASGNFFLNGRPIPDDQFEGPVGGDLRRARYQQGPVLQGRQPDQVRPGPGSGRDGADRGVRVLAAVTEPQNNVIFADDKKKKN